MQERPPASGCRRVTPALGPDATGVGWVYQHAMVAKSKPLAELRSLQDWEIRFALANAEGVAEVASFVFRGILIAALPLAWPVRWPASLCSPGQVSLRSPVWWGRLAFMALASPRA